MSAKATMQASEIYRELIGLLRAEETLTWSRFQTFLTVNAGLLVLLGLAFPQVIAGVTSHMAIQALAICICVFGATTAVLWLFVAGRSEAFYDHWFEQLKAVESENLEGVTIFNTAEEFFECGSAKIGSKVMRLEGRFCRVRIYTASKILSALMTVAWLGMLGAVTYELFKDAPPSPPAKVEIRVTK